MNAEAIIPDRPLADPAALGASLTQLLDTAATELAAELAAPTVQWNDKPQFAIEAPVPGRRDIYTLHQLYEWGNDGTEPHIILPIRKQALRFLSGGDVIFAKRVRHPGTVAHAWDQQVADAWNGGKWQARVQAALDATL